jgi:hypothetical protein
LSAGLALARIFRKPDLRQNRDRWTRTEANLSKSAKFFQKVRGEVPGRKNPRSRAKRSVKASREGTPEDDSFDFGSVEAATAALARVVGPRTELIRRAFVAAGEFRTFVRTIDQQVEFARWNDLLAWHHQLAAWILGEPGGRRVE